MLKVGVCLTLIASALAFDRSAPFIIAQGQKGSIGSLSSSASLETAIESIPCADLTLIFDQPKVHASDLSRFEGSFSALKGLMTPNSSILIPYARGDNAVAAIVSRLQQKCDPTSQTKAVGETDTLSLEESKIYVSQLSSLTGNIESQQAASVANERTMSALIQQVKSLTPNHVVVFTSSNPTSN
ncbi:UNVERIFIED_CONTAM: hypothetical protein HDU68_006794, partial [Siphonaria sp. JEL0065]